MRPLDGEPLQLAKSRVTLLRPLQRHALERRVKGRAFGPRRAEVGVTWRCAAAVDASCHRRFGSSSFESSQRGASGSGSERRRRNAPSGRLDAKQYPHTASISTTLSLCSATSLTTRCRSPASFPSVLLKKGSGSGDRCTTNVPKPPHNKVTAVRSTEWVGDFSRLESTTWRWWTRFAPDGTH